MFRTLLVPLGTLQLHERRFTSKCQIFIQLNASQYCSQSKCLQTVSLQIPMLVAIYSGLLEDFTPFNSWNSVSECCDFTADMIRTYHTSVSSFTRNYTFAGNITVHSYDSNPLELMKLFQGLQVRPTLLGNTSHCLVCWK